MEKVILTVLYIVMFYTLYAQEKYYPVIIEDYATLRFNQTHGGRNLEFSYMRRDGKHGFKGGINIFVNSKVKDNQANVYQNRFRAYKPLQHLGINLGYEYPLLWSKYSNVNLFAFYNMETFILGLRREGPRFLGLDLEDNLLYYIYEGDIQEPTGQVDFILGLGLSIKIFNNFYFCMTGGYGALLSFNGETHVREGDGVTDIEVSSQRWSIGINYRLRKKTVQRLYY